MRIIEVNSTHCTFRALAVLVFVTLSSLSADALAAKGEDAEITPTSEMAFFPEDSARDIFGTSADLTPQPELEWQPRENKPLDLAKQREEEEAAQERKASEILKAILSGRMKLPEAEQANLAQGSTGATGFSGATGASGAAKAITEDSIVSKFGSPDEDAPIDGVESAPKPFRGALMAFQAGNKELAFRYIRQYVRHVNNVKSRATEISDLMALAQAREGSPPAHFDFKQLPAEQRALFERDLQRERELQKNVDQGVAELPAEFRDMVAQASAQESSEAALLKTKSPLAPEVGSISELSEADVRTLARNKYAGRVPVDPQGEVKVIYFFRSKDRRAAEMGKIISALNQQYASNSNVDFVGMTIDQFDDQAVGAYRKYTGSQFKISDGSKAARQYGVVASPTTIVMAANDGRAFYEEGMLRQEYVDELVRMVQGVPAAKISSR